MVLFFHFADVASCLLYLSGLHFNIYIDNYFLLQALLIVFRELEIGACSTARVNSSAFPPDLYNQRKNIPWNKVSGGPVDAAGNVLAVQWQDNSVVHFLTTIQTLKEPVIAEWKKPHFSDYNRYKVGINVADQY